MHLFREIQFPRFIFEGQLGCPIITFHHISNPCLLRANYDLSRRNFSLPAHYSRQYLIQTEFLNAKWLVKETQAQLISLRVI